MSIKSPFRYPGGKSKKSIQNLILSYAPSDTYEYREPFVGGGGIFFAIDKSRYSKIWINDINSGLIEVYLALKNRPLDFISKVKDILPPDKNEECVPTKGTGKPYNKRLGLLFNEFKYNEEMDQALRYFFLNRTVWGGRVNYNPQFESRMYYSNPNGWNITKTDKLEKASNHLKDVEITNLSYEVLLDKPGNNVWIYLDPPYVVDTQFNKGSKLYEFGFSMEDHEIFVENVKKCKHKICISYDNQPKVKDWFKKSDGFNVFEHEWTYSGSSNKIKEKGKELIITNY